VPAFAWLPRLIARPMPTSHRLRPGRGLAPCDLLPAGRGDKNLRRGCRSPTIFCASPAGTWPAGGTWTGKRATGSG